MSRDGQPFSRRGLVLREIISDKVLHGGIVKKLRESGGISIIDFSASMNPLPPRLDPALDPRDLEYYPDDSYTLLKETIGRLFNRRVEEIAVGNGSIELIRVFCSCVLSPGDRVRIPSPTFGEYEYSARLAGAIPDSGNGRPKTTFLCNPNNPTGVLLPAGEVDTVLSAVVEEEGTLFLDEAFIELSDPGQSMVSCRDPSLFLLRSLTKSFSIPGIRFGYGFGDPDLIARMEATRPPWSVNAYAEHYALLAFAHYTELEQSRKYIEAEREWLYSRFADLPVRVNPSQANFILLDLVDDVTSLCNDLLRQGVLVRDCHSFGLPRSIRVAVRTRDENSLLIEAMHECLP
jgi:threonine-phosphate decarboxylase